MARALRAILPALGLLLSCGRSGLQSIEIGDLAAAGDTGTEEALPWGLFAESLDVPPCPAGQDLVVDTTAGELEGGDTTIADRAQAGLTLSLTEALWIAANRAGQDNIYFDPELFPADRPATILLASDTPLPGFASPVCIDGRRRGVGIDGNSSSLDIWDLGDGDLQIGLILLRHFRQSVEVGGQVAGCRYTNDRLADWSLLLNGGLAGPGNAFEGGFGVWVYPAGTVTGSFFGFDPARRSILSLEQGVLCAGGTVEQNVFLSRRAVLVPMSCAFRDNLVGVDPSGAVHPVVEVGVEIQTLSTGVVIGPANVIRGAGWALSIEDDRTAVRITQNSISGNAHGIVYYNFDKTTWPWVPIPTAGPVAPPTISAAATTQVDGLCDVAGTVEIFSDAGDQGEWYLGSVPCDGVGWRLETSVPGGRNVTATLTDQQNRTSAFSAPVAVP